MVFHMLFLIKYYLAKLGLTSETGQGLAEYAIIIMLVALVVIAALILVGEQLVIAYESVVAIFP